MLPTGTIVAGYRIDGVLGEGAMALVYRATHLGLDRPAALKLIGRAAGADKHFRERFEREGRAQAAIDHPNVVPVYDFGQSEHGLFLAARLVEGSNLKALVREGSLDPARTVRLLAQCADALDAAHAAGVIHRDVKPQNILVDTDDRVWLADFGMTKALNHASLTKTGQLLGTIDYMAPEQIQTEAVTGATDVYGLACVLYECLTGEVPFPRPNIPAVLYAHVSSPPPCVTDARPDLPAAIDAVVAAGLAKEPSGRPASATELIAAAAAALSSA